MESTANWRMVSTVCPAGADRTSCREIHFRMVFPFHLCCSRPLTLVAVAGGGDDSIARIAQVGAVGALPPECLRGMVAEAARIGVDLGMLIVFGLVDQDRQVIPGAGVVRRHAQS